MASNNQQIYNYTVILEPEEEGSYHAFCPLIKGCHFQGETFEEAIENITEAIELYLESLKTDNQPIPQSEARSRSLIRLAFGSIALSKGRDQVTLKDRKAY